MIGKLLHYGLAALPVSVLAAFALFVLPRLRGYSGRWRCVVWGLVALRLLIPFGILQEGMFSVSLPPAVTQAVSAAETWDGTAVPVGPLLEEEGGWLELASMAYCLLWPAGTALYYIVHAASYCRFKRRLKGSCRLLKPEEIPWEKTGKTRGIPRIYASTVVETPMLCGLLRPRILLPEREWDSEDLMWILRHESAHWKRGDLWIKHFSLLINGIYWWNPVVYWLRRQWSRDLELRCDERVVHGLGPRERIRYGETLLRLRVPERRIPLMAAGFGSRKTLLRLRVENLLDTGRRKRGILTLALVLCGVLLSGSLLSVQAARDLLPDQPNDCQESLCEQEDGGIQWSWPLHGEKIRITSGYGNRWGVSHNGVDLTAGQNPTGQPIYPAAPGTVVAVNQNADGSYGRYVVLYHGENWYSLYSQCRDVQAAVGQRVTSDEIIAHVGNTGNSTGPHLHFGVRHGESFVDPLELLP